MGDVINLVAIMAQAQRKPFKPFNPPRVVEKQEPEVRQEVHSVKRDRFLRLAASRLDRALADLALLAQCSNRENYDYKPEDVEEMLSALENVLADLRVRFTSETRPLPPRRWFNR